MILLVEDDALTRVTTAELLTAKGFKVRTAGTFVEAVQHLRQHCPRMLVIDLVLPCSRSGLELLREKTVREQWGRIVVVITSALDSAGDDITLPPHTYALQKPFKIERLIQLLKEANGVPA